MFIFFCFKFNAIFIAGTHCIMIFFCDFYHLLSAETGPVYLGSQAWAVFECVMKKGNISVSLAFKLYIGSLLGQFGRIYFYKGIIIFNKMMLFMWNRIMRRRETPVIVKPNNIV